MFFSFKSNCTILTCSIMNMFKIPIFKNINKTTVINSMHPLRFSWFTFIQKAQNLYAFILVLGHPWNRWQIWLYRHFTIKSLVNFDFLYITVPCFSTYWFPQISLASSKSKANDDVPRLIVLDWLSTVNSTILIRDDISYDWIKFLKKRTKKFKVVFFMSVISIK